MGSVRVAIVGVGNCAASLVQGVEFYKNADPEDRVPGLMHVQFGPYHVRDIKFVAAFDVDGKKVGSDLADAIGASENNTIKFCDVPPTGITVQRGVKVTYAGDLVDGVALLGGAIGIIATPAHAAQEVTADTTPQGLRAQGGPAKSLDIMLVLDTTASMNRA